MGAAAQQLSPNAGLACLFFLLLVPLAAAGLSLIYAGLSRAHGAAHAMLSSLCVVGIAAIVYFAFGFAWQGYAGGAAHTVSVGGKPWNWLAAQPFFFRGLDGGGSRAWLTAALGMLTVAVAALIPLGSGAGRWRLGAICISTALLAGVVFPLFAHWVWGGGWLAQLGANYGLGRGFVDIGGSGAIQVVGGLAALSMAWILGRRRGKYSSEGMPAAIPGHDSVIVLFGCLLAWMGWIGLNSAGAILFAGVNPGQTIRVVVNTTLAAATAVLAAAGTTRLRFGKTDASLSANGWVGGLVASSAGCALLAPLGAAAIGLVAGILVPLTVELLEVRLKVDDPAGAISVHGVGGIWGLLALAIFARFPGQWLAQLVGVATLLGLVFPLIYGFNWLIDRIYPQRVSAEGERLGMDLHELGAEAYPDFVSNLDEFTQG